MREAVAGRDGDPLRRRDAAGRQRGAEHGRHRVGDLARPRVVGRDARDGEQPQVLRRRSRARRSPRPTPRRRASRPARQTPSHGLIRLPAVGRRDGPRRLRRPAAAALRGRAAAELADEQVLEAVVDLDVDEPACRRATAAARDPAPPPGSPCSRSPAVSTIRSWPSAVSRTTWNQPSASDTKSSEPSGSQRGADIDAPLAGDDPRRRRSRRRRARSARSRRRPARAGP